MDGGVRELRANFSRYLDKVKGGAVINVTDRNHLVARLVPATDGDIGTASKLAALLAAGAVNWSGEPLSAAAPQITLHGTGPSRR